MTAIRSVSFTRSSSAPLTVVLPWAATAATNTAGNSSIASETSRSGTSMPDSGAPVTTRSATGSPPASRSDRTSIRAPMSFRISITPVREGFMPTFSMVSVRPGERQAPTMKKVAEEMSPGTASAVPVRR